MEIRSSPSKPPPVMRGCSPRRTYRRDRAANSKETISPNFKNCVLRTESVIKSNWESHPSRTVDAMHDGTAATTRGLLDDRWYTSWRRKRLKCLQPLYKALFIFCICYQFHVVFASCRKEDGRTVLREAEGTISDGNDRYPEDTECQWLIEASDARMSICLHFTMFETECTYDFLHIFDGDSFSSPLIGSFSGNKLPPTLCASSGKMLLYLYSDTNYNLHGFEASYTVSDCPLDCLGQGECVDYQCQCNTGYHGNYCQFYNCPDECGSSLSQGSCNFNLAQPKCDCVDGYIGENCSLSTIDNTGWGSSFVLSSGGDAGLTPRTGHGAVYHSEDDTMWVFGGYNLKEILEDFIKYKFEDNTWITVLPSSGSNPVGRYSHTMDIVDGEIVMFGGILDDGSFSSELWSFDIHSEEWNLLPSILSIPGTAHHSSCIVNGTILYIIGGRGNDSFFHHYIFRYDMVERTGWELVEPAGGLPDAIGVAEHSSVYYAPSRTIYVFGGLREHSHKFGIRSSDIYTFHVDRRFWQKLSGTGSDGSSISYGRTFHTASLIGDNYMVVYGGNTHQHVSSSGDRGKEDCYENSIHLFHFDCNSWVEYDVLAQDFTGDIASYKDNGRFGHSAVVRDGTTLVITGGFRGVVTNDIIAMKMPGTVAVNPLTSGENRTAEDQCLYHKSHSVCQQDPSCAHCDSTNECINRKYAQDCTGEVKYGYCPGVCSQASTCHACLSLDKDTEGSGVKGQCGWCVQERTCYSISEAHTRCGGTSAAGWWGDTMTQIEDFSQCVLEDFPPGMILTTHHVPANREFPDKVEIVNETHQELSLIDDYIPPVSSERGLWSLTGVLHPLNAVPSKQSSRLQVFVASKNIQTKLVMSTDMTASHAETVALFNSTDRKTVEAFRPLNSTLIPDRSSEYYMRLEGLWLSETDKSYILELSWNGDVIDRDYIASRYLRPYTSGNCNIHWNCNSCLTDALCGWCPLSQTCQVRNDTALPQERCGATAGTLRHHLTIDSAYCQDCNLYTDCVSCVEGPHCEWFQNDKTTLCLRRASRPEAINSSSECGLSCYERTSCKECTELDSCAWCAEDNKCFPFKHYIKTYAYGQCSHWFDQPSHCPNCSAYTNCQDCLEKFQCGWCGNTVNPLNGICTFGDFAGPMTDQNCSSLVGEVYNLPLSEAADWSYETCPDVEECKLGLYKCHENASCLNTYTSYECKCNQGYKGNGIDSCVRTCFHECIHGVCSEAPLFECDCDLGWTGLNCSTDCGCTFHSSCSQGVGICDDCHYNTMGERCDQCSPGSYGDPLRPEGCEQCDCNGHGDPEKGYCNESTQECFCMDNTMGDHCEECQPGFYGDPRNGNRCYLECAGRTILWNITKVALGSFEGDRASNPAITSCLWILSHFETEDDVRTLSSDKRIQLTVDRINTTCGRDYAHVYDGIPAHISGWSDSSGILLGSFCGYGNMDPLTVTAESGILTVVFEASLQQESASTGFTALYEVVDCDIGCEVNRSCVEGKCVCDETHQGELCDQEICPSDCSMDRGSCDEVEGLCRCLESYGGSSCDRIVSNPGAITSGVWTPLYLPQYHQTGGTVQGRVGHSMFKTRDGHLVIFGGYREEDGFLNDMWSYNPADHSWTEISYANAAPSGRYFHGSVYLSSKNQLFVFGGMNETEVSNEFWIYQMESRNWTKQEIDPSHVIPPLAGHTLTAFGEHRFFLVGGFSPQESFYPELQEYDTRQGYWQSRVPKGIAPTGIYGHSAVWHDESGALYVYGGYRFARGQVWASDVLYSYHVSSNTWNILPPASDFVPSSHIFHSAITTSRYLFIIGGGTAESNFTISVQAYHYDCNTWAEVFLADDGPQPALGQSAVEIDGAVYVYGGFASKVMGSLYKLNLPEDLCRQYGTTEACNSAPGCTTCVVNDTFFHCAYTESCGGTGSVTVNGVLPNGTIQCNVTEVPRNDCEKFKSCGECLTTYPAHVAVKSTCKWCYGCPEGTCIETSSNCEDYCENNQHEEITSINKCSELVCPVADCEECGTMRGCMWTRQFQPHTAETKFYLSQTPSYSWNCYSNTLLDVIPNEIEVLTSPPLPCPSHCHTYTSCWECLESDGADGGWSSCVWSSQLHQCMSPSFLYLQCITGRCGPILYGNGDLCPVPCSHHRGCHSCFQQSNCGWCAVGYNASIGVCMEGTLSNPVDGMCEEQTISPTDGILGVRLCTSREEYIFDTCCEDEILRLAREEAAVWHFATCPPENECTNGEHNCKENERCVDTFESFICECKQRYAKDSNDICQPVCSQKCFNGTCVAPDTCMCDFGFVGESCGTPCQCNRHSDCAGPEDTQNCSDCQHNTMGPACEFCQTFFVGNATNGGVCEPCRNKCNGNSDFCVSLKKYNASDPSSWENKPGPMEDDVLCLNCSNNSEGDECQSCKDGYFTLNGICQLCQCNGHSDYCDKTSGEGCLCQNHTRSPNCPTDNYAKPCYRHQCSICTEGEVFRGEPTNGHQCYRQVEMNLRCFGDGGFRTGCPASSGGDPLPPGKSVLYVVQPSFVDLDIRVTIDVTYGSMDVYISHEPDMFVIESQSGMHTVMIDADKAVDTTDIIPKDVTSGMVGRKKRQSDSVTVPTDQTVNKVTAHYAQGLNSFVTVMDSDFVMVIRNVENRLVVTIPHRVHALSTKWFYFILLATENSQPRNDTPGALVFRQDIPQIDLFIFFSAFLSSFFKLLAILIAIWKLKVSWETRQAERARSLEMEHRRSRPFGHVIVYMEEIADPLPAPPAHPSRRTRRKSPRSRKERTLGSAISARSRHGAISPPAVLPAPANPAAGAVAVHEKLPYSPGLVALEPTDDGMAGVGTVVIALPGGTKAPLQACLGSGLMRQSKHNLSLMHPPRITRPANKQRQNSGCTYRPV